MEKDYEKICPFRPFASKIGYSGLAACIDCQVFFSHHHSSRTAARRGSEGSRYRKIGTRIGTQMPGIARYKRGANPLMQNTEGRVRYSKVRCDLISEKITREQKAGA